MSKKLKQQKRLKSEARQKPYTKLGIACFLDTILGTQYANELDYIDLNHLKTELNIYWEM